MKKKKLGVVLIICVILIIAGTSIWILSNRPIQYRQPIILQGTIVTPSKIIDTGWIVIDDGMIQSVSLQKPNIPNAIDIDTQGIIFPGLVDVHNHVSFNVFPRWQPGKLFSNRYEWREDDEYKENVSNPYENLRSRYFCEMNTYGEVRALVGGTTSILATAPSNCIKGHVRNLDHDSGFYGLFELDRSHIKNSVNFPTEVDEIQEFLLNGQSEAFFIHLAEGIDESSSAEFEKLNDLGLLSAKTIIIHGTALELNQYKMMSEKGASLIWSPRSNIELYGQTADILSALENDVTIAIAPDWAITGSSNILDELYYAAEWNNAHLEGHLSDKDLVEMVTINPAMIAGIAEYVGTIQVGLHADLLIIQGDKHHPYRALIEADPSDVQLVMVNGIPMYGSLDNMELFWKSSKFTTLEILGQSKAILGPGFSSIIESLKIALLSENVQLAPLVEAR